MAMTPRASLRQLGKLVARDIGKGRLSQGTKDAGEALASQPDAVLEILSLLFAEACRKRPDQGLVSAFLFMLQQALEATRWRIENGNSEATDLVKELRVAIAEAGASRKLPAEVFVMIAQCFAAAKLDLGDDVREMIAAISRTQFADGGGLPSTADFEEHLGQLVEELDHDPFLIHGQLAELLEGLPDQARVELISTIVLSPIPCVREAAAGWLLDAKATVANAVAGFLAQSASQGHVSADTINRLVAMRNWVGEDRRSAIDGVIREARKNGVASVAAAQIQIVEVLASACDGAGAQSIFVMTRHKRKFSASCVLFKHGFGIRDAWVRHDMTRNEADALFDQIDFEVGGFDASLDTIRTILEHGLAINAETGEPIPFGLLAVVEATGIASMSLRRIETGELLGRLMEDIPAAARSDAAISRALQASKRWGREHDWFDSWFEDGDDALKAFKAEKTVKARTQAILLGVVNAKRGRWAELLVWTALMARDEPDAEEWIELVLVARELLGDRSIADIPMAVEIARNSVEALRQAG